MHTSPVVVATNASQVVCPIPNPPLDEGPSLSVSPPDAPPEPPLEDPPPELLTPMRLSAADLALESAHSTIASAVRSPLYPAERSLPALQDHGIGRVGCVEPEYLG